MEAERILAVSVADYLEQVGPNRYVGLPREEIERLYGSVQVHARSPEELRRDKGYLPLVTFTVIHYNYTWLAFERAQRSLGLTATVCSHGTTPPFLDDAFARTARRSLEEAGIVSGAVDWRLAGLIRESQLGLVYIARLRQHWSPHENRSGLRVVRCNNGELQTEQRRFDAWSQLLIANLSSV
jgi:hypothetical protein